MKKDVVVKKSSLAGKGVFANRDFSKGEVVLAWNPKILTSVEFMALPAYEKQYVYIVDDGYLYTQSPEKYVNHSCNSNTKTSGLNDVAKRNIKKGEEITADYSDDGIVTFKCNCGSKNCRGTVS